MGSCTVSFCLSMRSLVSVQDARVAPAPLALCDSPHSPPLLSVRRATGQKKFVREQRHSQSRASAFQEPNRINPVFIVCC